MHRLNLANSTTLLRAGLLQVPRRAGRKDEVLKPSHLGQLLLGDSKTMFWSHFLGFGIRGVFLNRSKGGGEKSLIK